jgi:hypothetical protein
VKIRLTEGGGNEQTELAAVLCGVYCEGRLGIVEGGCDEVGGTVMLRSPPQHGKPMETGSGRKGIVAFHGGSELERCVLSMIVGIISLVISISNGFVPFLCVSPDKTIVIRG